jgi:chromosome partitioning protein
MFVVSLTSQKGGAGKTTLAVHLATAAAAEGHKVLLMDVDPQGSAMLWANRRGDKAPDVMAGHPATLAKEVERARAEGYDQIFLDTAPHADHAALQAARVADLVVIPCRPATFDLAAISATLDLCKLANKQAVVVLNSAPIRSKVVQEAAEAIREAGGQLATTTIHQRVAFQHCLIDGRTAAEFEPDGAAANEIAKLLANLQTRNPANTSADKPAARKAKKEPA